MFHVKHVANFDDADVEGLLNDPGIFRDCRKGGPTINNARVLAGLERGLGGVLARRSEVLPFP